MYERLQKGPTFLFLGQKYSHPPDGHDSFLSEILRKFSPGVELPYSYTSIFQTEASVNPEVSLAWMQERCERLSTPDWLRTVGNFQWSGVYTTALDCSWIKAFHAPWREFYSIFHERQIPQDPRNKHILHCTFLFGSVDRTNVEERPPLTSIEWKRRRPNARQLVRRLPEYITPFGTLLIEGYAGDKDWLPPDDLFPAIDLLEKGQAIIFSTTAELEKDPDLEELAKAGKLEFRSESLATFLRNGFEGGHLPIGTPEASVKGRMLEFEKGRVNIPTNLANRVSQSAIILDDLAMTQPKTLSENARYLEFKRFLSESSTRPIWSGYWRGFNFRREFEEELQSAVIEQIESKSADKLIVLHGQTGVGKTVALGNLAFRISRGKKLPVLFIERGFNRPKFSDIEMFCKWSEDAGAHKTIIIWDGMESGMQYEQFLDYLLSKGRKFILVGSQYKLSKSDFQSQVKYIEAPGLLSQNEQSSISEFLDKFDSKFSKQISSDTPFDAEFLVALYRLLPDTRGKIRTGVEREATHTQRTIEQGARTNVIKPKLTTLGKALIDANVIKEEQFFSDKLISINGEKISESERLLSLVMVPGRFGISVPVEILLRALGKPASQNFVDLLKSVDMIRWREDFQGNIFLAPRHSLEAKLVVDSRLGSPMAEIDVAVSLLKSVNTYNWGSSNVESQFAIDLIRHMGPNEKDKDYFAPCFLKLADTLTFLRVEQGMNNTDLMLQEATLLRELIRTDEFDREQVNNFLNRAESVYHEARKILDEYPQNNRKLSLFMVEMAGTLGCRADLLLRDGKQNNEAIEIFRECRDLLIEARLRDPSNRYCIDVLGWTTIRLLQSGVLNAVSQAEVEADVLHAFELAQAEDAISPERFDWRRMQLGNVIGNQVLSDEAFNSLCSQGSTAGYYLRALQTAGNLPVDKEFSKEEIGRCESATSYLMNNYEKISRDPKCLFLLVRLTWGAKVKHAIFSGQRRSAALNRNDWQQMLTLLTDLMVCGEAQHLSIVRYLFGLTKFHLGDFVDAIKVFEELEQEFVHGKMRPKRWYLATNSQGRPEIFAGDVEKRSAKKGYVYVSKFRTSVPFIPQEFYKPDIQPNDPLTDFHIAFSFMGPIAEPASFYEDKK